MEKIAPGKYVALSYELYEKDGNGSTLVHSVTADDPEAFIFGVTPGLIPALEKSLEGLEQGSDFDIFVPAAEGFPYNPDDVATLDKNLFVVDGKFDAEAVFPGAYIPMMTADGMRITGKVVEVGDSEVVMDFNHPLVGKDLTFKGKVEVVREPTPEELHPARSCGGCGGGCGSNGGDCGPGGCCGGCN